MPVGHDANAAFCAHLWVQQRHLVATKDMYPRQNSELNAEKLPLVLTISTDRPSIVASQQGDAKRQGAMQTADVAQVASSSHEDTKTLLTVASIGAGVIYYLVAR